MEGGRKGEEQRRNRVFLKKKQCERVVANTVDFFYFVKNFKSKYLGEKMSYRDRNDT